MRRMRRGGSYPLSYRIAREYQDKRLHGEHEAGYHGGKRVVQDDEYHGREAEERHVYAAGEIAGAVFNLHVPLVLDLNLKALVLFDLLGVPELRMADPEDRPEGAGEAGVDALGKIRKAISSSSAAQAA